MIPFATNMRAAGLMSLTMALFCVSDAILKGLFQRLPIGEVMALRGAAVILFLSGGLSLFGYVLLILGLVFLPPLVLTGAMVVGLGDTWLDVRRRGRSTPA